VGTVKVPGDDRSGFAVIDVETTGISPDEERIVEVGVVILGPDGRETGSFCTLIDPGCDPGPTFVHRITPQMLVGAPTFAAIQPFLAETLSGRVLVGHNIDDFDLAFLRAECARAGGVGLVPAGVPTVDTLCVAQAQLHLRGKARLVECCTHFGISWDDHHSALGDARVTAALFRSMRAQLGDDALGIDTVLSAATGTSWPGASPVRPPVWARRPPSGGPAPDEGVLRPEPSNQPRAVLPGAGDPGVPARPSLFRRLLRALRQRVERLRDRPRAASQR
jgi:DNA polymerase III epsilon subunit-like protein